MDTWSVKVVDLERLSVDMNFKLIIVRTKDHYNKIIATINDIAAQTATQLEEVAENSKLITGEVIGIAEMDVTPFELFQTDKKVLVINDPKEINVILEMRYLPEEYRERLIGYLRCLRDDMKK